MNKFLSILCLSILTSCSMPVWDGTISLGSLPDLTEGLPTVTSMTGAWLITSRIEYEVDSPGGGCRLPIDTYTEGKGDCEDIVALFLALMRTLGEEAYLVAIQYGDVKHAIVHVGDYYLDAQTFGHYYDPTKIIIMSGEYTLEQTILFVRSVK